MRRTAAVLCLAALLALGSAFFRTPIAGAATDVTAASELVAAINQLRISAGLAPLTVNSQLTSVAVSWSQEMSQSAALSHNPSLASEAPAGWQKLGENVGSGTSEPTIEQAFVNSPEHYANMVDPAFDYGGVSTCPPDPCS